MAASEDKRIKSVVTAASWLHDAEAVKLFYGGEAKYTALLSLWSLFNNSERAKAFLTKLNNYYGPTYKFA